MRLPVNPTRVMVRQLLGVIAQYERAVIRGRMLAGKAAKVARGGYGGGAPPLGFEAKERELVPVASEAAVIERVLALHREGFSLRQIAEQLAAAGFQTKRGCSTWHPTVIARIIERGSMAEAMKGHVHFSCGHWPLEAEVRKVGDRCPSCGRLGEVVGAWPAPGG